jgi:hypothetical protein
VRRVVDSRLNDSEGYMIFFTLMIVEQCLAWGFAGKKWKNDLCQDCITIIEQSSDVNNPLLGFVRFTLI